MSDWTDPSRKRDADRQPTDYFEPPPDHQWPTHRVSVPGGWIYWVYHVAAVHPVYVPDPSVWGPDNDTAILAAVHSLKLEVHAMSDALQTSIDTLIADNVSLKAAVDAAPAAIATLVAAAIAGAVGAGATPEQLQAMADLHTALGGETAELTAALAGTPPTPPAPPA